ncbi:hypothetical protein [Myroides injenensis]|nr:hypothetical protein [Myroides injenensis]
MKYTESQLEQAFISHLEAEGYHYINGKELTTKKTYERRTRAIFYSY